MSRLVTVAARPGPPGGGRAGQSGQAEGWLPGEGRAGQAEGWLPGEGRAGQSGQAEGWLAGEGGRHVLVEDQRGKVPP
jgi:hypothetical protein